MTLSEEVVGKGLGYIIRMYLELHDYLYKKCASKVERAPLIADERLKVTMRTFVKDYPYTDELCIEDLKQFERSLEVYVDYQTRLKR